MQRYEFNDDKSSKFWQIEQQGGELHISWGKIGTSGQSQVKAFDDEAKASAAKDKLVKEKTGKGYAATGEAPMAAGATPKVASAAPAKSKPKPKPPAEKAPAGVAAPLAGDAPLASAAQSASATKTAQGDARGAASPSGADPAGQAGDEAPSDAAAREAGTLPSHAALQAPREVIEAWLTEQRQGPSFFETTQAAWVRLLAHLKANPAKDRHLSTTPAQLARLLQVDELTRVALEGMLLDNDIAHPYGNGYYFSEKAAVNLQQAIHTCEAREADMAATLADLRTHIWQALGSEEPAQRLEARLGQRLNEYAHTGAQSWALRQAEPAAPPSTRTMKEAWHLLRAAKLVFVSSSLSDALHQPAIDALDARMLTQTLAEPDLASDQVLLCIALYVRHEDRIKNHLGHLMAYLVQAHGMAQVVRMLADATQVMFTYHYKPGGREWGMRARLGDDDATWAHEPLDGVLQQLRMWLLAADDAQWQAAVHAGIEVIDTMPAPDRAWLGPMFAEAPEVAQAVMASYANARSLPKSAQWLLVALPKGEDAQRLLALKPEIEGDSVFRHPQLLEDLLIKLGDDALPLLVNAADMPTMGNRLALTNHPDAVVALGKQVAGNKDAQVRLKLAVARWPLAGAIGLARLCAQGGKDTPLLLPLLRQAMGQLGPAVALLPAWLQPAANQLVSDVLAKQAEPAEVAAAADLPPVLANPPWLQAKKRVASKALSLAPLPLADAMGEQTPLQGYLSTSSAEALAHSKTDALALAAMLSIQYRWRSKESLPYANDLAKAIRARDAQALVQAWEAGLAQERAANAHFWPRLDGFACLALPDDMGLPLWNAKAGTVETSREEIVLAHWGVQALPGFARMVRANPTALLAQALCFGATELAPTAARAAFKLKTLRRVGLKWLLQWPEHALCGLIAPALGRAGEAKDVAARALRFLATNGHEALLLEVASRYGDAAVNAAVQTVLSEDPLDLHPSKIPGLPDFWQPQSWSRPVLVSGKALGADATDALGHMLAFPRNDGLYEGIAQAQAACTPESLADFGWDLFSAWLAAGAPSKDNWAFSALAFLGNDDAARRLTPLIRSWPGEAAHARAVSGLDILEGIGTDTALMLLNGIAQKLKFKGLQDKAGEKIAAIAEARGLTTEELEDRLAPDLGLDERGALVLDFGPRQFKVGFDETLKPWVRDFTGEQDGARLKDLPKPIKTDDDAKAKDAGERYKLLKKDAKTIAAQQIQRFEVAMCQQRRWTSENFRDFIATHPLVRHIAQRLIWGVYAVNGQMVDEELRYPNFGGELLACFRLAEDGGLTTADDEPFALPTAPEGCAIRVGVPHALQMPVSDAQAFGQLFADYELLQPFAQIGRDTYALTDAERAGKVLARWKDTKLPTGRILGLANKAWRRGEAQDGGGVWYFTKPLSDGRLIEMNFEPGFSVGYVDDEPEQTIGELNYGTRAAWGGMNAESQREWHELDIIGASELIRDMELLCEPVAK